MRLHEEEYEWEGITYRITVDQHDDGIWGGWVCNECGGDGHSSKNCTSVEEAVRAAKMNLQMHPAKAHGS